MDQKPGAHDKGIAQSHISAACLAVMMLWDTKNLAHGQVGDVARCIIGMVAATAETNLLKAMIERPPTKEQLMLCYTENADRTNALVDRMANLVEVLFQKSEQHQ